MQGCGSLRASRDDSPDVQWHAHTHRARRVDDGRAWSGSARRLDDMSPLLASVGGLADVYRVSRADVVKNGMGPDPRDPSQRPLGKAARDIYIPDLRLGSGIIPGEPVEGIKTKTRDFH